MATDLDGTLVRPDGSVSARNAAALARAQAAGATVVLVTGRPPRRVVDLARSLGCHPLVLCANGALSYDAARDRVVDHHPIDPATAARVVRRLRAAVPGAVFAVEHPGGFGHEPDYPLAFDVPAGTVVAPAEDLVAVGPTKLLARCPPTSPSGPAQAPETLVAAVGAAVGDLAEASTSAGDGLVEVAARGVTKATALAGLAAQLGVDWDEVVAFGDMLNDLPMLEWAGLGVAMGNAHDLVKASAGEVTASCLDDGVAAVLERLLAPPAASLPR